jgi:hypothetical protein
MSSIQATQAAGNSGIFARSAQMISDSAIKVYETVKKFFIMLKDLVLFPTRYVGSKDWSLIGIVPRFFAELAKSLVGRRAFDSSNVVGKGYHRGGFEELSKEQVKPYIKYGCITAGVHANKGEWTEPFGLSVVSPKTLVNTDTELPEGVEVREKCFFDPNTCLKVGIFEDQDTLYVTFGALSSHESEVSDVAKKEELKKTILSSGAAMLMGYKPEIYEQANALVEKIMGEMKTKNKRIELVGQCFGGSLASYVALKQQLPATCLNSLALGAGLQQEIGSDRLAEADKYITHVSADTDIASDNFSIGIFDRALSLGGVTMPGNFGNRKMIPTVYSKTLETHDYILGSMLVHAGYDKRDKPASLRDKPGAEAIFTKATKKKEADSTAVTAVAKKGWDAVLGQALKEGKLKRSESPVADRKVPTPPLVAAAPVAPQSPKQRVRELNPRFDWSQVVAQARTEGRIRV